MMLSTGFFRECLLVNGELPAPYPLPFGSSAKSLISLVQSYDGSDASLLTLLMGSCSKGTSLGCQFLPPFHPALRIDG